MGGAEPEGAWATGSGWELVIASPVDSRGSICAAAVLAAGLAMSRSGDEIVCFASKTTRRPSAVSCAESGTEMTNMLVTRIVQSKARLHIPDLLCQRSSKNVCC